MCLITAVVRCGAPTLRRPSSVAVAGPICVNWHLPCCMVDNTGIICCYCVWLGGMRTENCELHAVVFWVSGWFSVGMRELGDE